MTSKVAVGALIISHASNRVLLNLRAKTKTHPLQWSLWGGMVEDGESTKDTLLRELREEIGFEIPIEKIYPFDIFESKDGHFRYYTFVCVVDTEFTPTLNVEAEGYAWFNIGTWPRPLHHGAKQSFCSNKSLEKLHIIANQHKA